MIRLELKSYGLDGWGEFYEYFYTFLKELEFSECSSIWVFLLNLFNVHKIPAE